MKREHYQHLKRLYLIYGTGEFTRNDIYDVLFLDNTRTEFIIRCYRKYYTMNDEKYRLTEEFLKLLDNEETIQYTD